MSSPSKTHRGLLGIGDGDEDKKSTKLGKLLTKKSKSFLDGRQQISNVYSNQAVQLRRPNTHPNLLSPVKFTGGISSEISTIPTKLLLNVNLQRSPGAVQVVMPPESTVGDLIAVVVRRYVKEERRPFLPTNDPSCFDLHFSQFSLESLDRTERLIKLGSRNFFLCLNKTVDASSSSSSSCSNEVEKTIVTNLNNDLQCLRFMHFML